MQSKAKLTDDIHIPAPFDLVFCGRRETVKEPGHLELRLVGFPPPALGSKAMRFFIGGRLTHQGSVLGSDEFGQLKKTETGKIEIWLDPRFVSPVL